MSRKEQKNLVSSDFNQETKLEKQNVEENVQNTSDSVENPKTLIYVGSTLPQGALQQYSVFNNGIPKTLSDHIDKCPAIAHLIVPISDLHNAQSNMAITGTMENALNQQIQTYVRGGK